MKCVLAVLGVLAVVVLAAALPGCGGSEGGLKVKVVDASGAAISGAKVVSNTQPEGQLKVTGITLADGYVTFNGIAAGGYSFYISAAGFQQKDFTATVAGGKTADITITMTAQ
jgi:hypothetical protein